MIGVMMTTEINIEEKLGKFDLFGKFMSKADLKFQYISSLSGFFMIMLSLIFYLIYNFGLLNWTGISIFQIHGNIFWRIFYGLNSICGLLIIFSSFAASYQQYQQYKQVQQIQDLFSSAVPEVNKEIKENAVSV